MKLSNVSSRYGAPMGRSNTLPADKSLSCKLHLVRLQWVDGDYDEGGAYWGRNGCNHVYRAYGDVGEVAAEVFVRAITHAAAKALVREELPNARFYN